jgi:aryl-alcohol dehydrogenase
LGLDMCFLQNGRTVRGVVQGDSDPQIFIPRLVDLMLDGKLPVERMMTFYRLDEINRAAADAAARTTIKPVLRMPN